MSAISVGYKCYDLTTRLAEMQMEVSANLGIMLDLMNVRHWAKCAEFNTVLERRPWSDIVSCALKRCFEH